MMALGLGRSLFPKAEVDALAPAPRAVLGGILYVGDGVVAPSEQSKRSWTSTSLVMPLLYELQILFSGGPAPSGVNVVITGTYAFSMILTLIRTL